ncbi:MAG: hypothetical protein GQ570_07655 [Helicobacteraceae bacterium]|nr:hypothetical protein [Helicobacteraceae bacterium]
MRKIIPKKSDPTFKEKLFNTFRELFIHHYSSLEFRAKLFALVIAASGRYDVKLLELIQVFGMEIYQNKERAHFLVLTTQEYCDNAINIQNGNLDSLIESIVKEAKRVPRYTKKIDIDHLRAITRFNADPVTSIYQERILEFLETMKKDNEK